MRTTAPGQNNFGGYTNDEVDGWFDEPKLRPKRTNSKNCGRTLRLNSSTMLSASLLWQFPSVTAYNNSLQGVDAISINPTIFHGFWNWTYEG